MDEAKKKPWENLEWGKIAPGRIKYYEDTGQHKNAERFKDMMKKHRRWLKSDEGRSERAIAQLYKHAAMDKLQARHIESSLLDMAEQCRQEIESLTEDMESGLYEMTGIDWDEADMWREMYHYQLNSAEMMHERWHEIQFACEDIEKRLDDVMAACWQGEYKLLGWNFHEEDFYGLDGRAGMELGRDEAIKRLKHLTKDELIETMSHCVNLALAYMNIQGKINSIKMATYLAKGDLEQLLNDIETVTGIYDKLNPERVRNEFSGEWYICTSDREEEKRFDRAVKYLPEEAWVL